MAEERLTLRMRFLDAGGKKRSVHVQDPRYNLTGSEIAKAMNDMLATNVLESLEGPYESILDARIIATSTTRLEV